MFFLCFYDHIWPHHFWATPLLAQTAFGPLSDQTVLCPNLCEIILETICCSCLVFWAMDHPVRDPPCPTVRIPLCGVGVWLLCRVGAVCEFKIFVNSLRQTVS